MLPLVLILGASPLLAGNDVQLLGWSGDGTSLVWEQTLTSTSARHHYFEKTGKKAEVPLEKVMKLAPAARAKLTEIVSEPSEDGSPSDEQVDDQATIVTVHELKTGAQKQYFTAYQALTLQAAGPKQKRFEKYADVSAYEAWKKSAGLVASPSLEGPRGARASVTVAGKVTTTWSVNDDLKVVFTVTRGVDTAITSFVDGGGAMYTPERAVTVWWDATGKRAAFAIDTGAAQTMRSKIAASTEIYLLTVPPRVEVLASARLKAEGERVAALVEKAGFAVNVVGVASKDRSSTVVYADDKHQADAKTLAAALGASVDKLTWKANGELVVAVGQ